MTGSSVLVFPVFVVAPAELDVERKVVEELLWRWNESFSNARRTCLLPVNPEQVDTDECDLMVAVLRSDRPVSNPVVELLATHSAKDGNMAVCVSQKGSLDPTVGGLLAAAEDSATILPFVNLDDLNAKLGPYITEVGDMFALHATKVLSE